MNPVKDKESEMSSGRELRRISSEVSPLSGRKILFVITKSNWGGAQQYVYTLARQAQEAGATSVVALGGSGDPGASEGLLSERLHAAGIRTIFLTSFTRDINITREWSAFFELLTVVRKEKPDILHLNSSKAGGIGALVGRIADVRHIVFTAHGWPHQEPRALPARAFIWMMTYVTVLLAHATIVLSRFEYLHAPALFLRKRLTIIPNGVDDFTVLHREAARAVLVTHDPRIKSYGQLILSTSELHTNKGIDTLIDSFARIAPTHPDAALILMHDGEERTALIAQATAYALAERIFFLGFVPNARSLLRAADVFVLPSRKEGLPFGLLEAGRAGVPVIASEIGTIPEVIRDTVTGILIPSDDIHSLSTALAQLLDNRFEAEKFGHALQKHVQESFSEAHMIQETFRLYRSLLVGSKARAN